MHRSHFRLAAAMTAAAVVCLAAAGSAAAATHWANLRMVTHTGRTLAEFRQYTGSTTVRATKDDKDCFGTRSSGKRYRLDGSNALGIVKDAMASDSGLRPLVLSDAFVDDGFGLGICSIGGFETVGFSYWDLIRNDLAATTGAEFIPVQNGDQVLWYFTSGSEPTSGPRVLELRGPAAAGPGDAFNVKVVRFTSHGNANPAAGVDVFAGTRRLGSTNSQGELRVHLSSSAVLQADGTPSDIPSNHVPVCVAAQASQCPHAHGARIYGSAHADRIKATRGWDRINARGGADVVDLESGGKDRVNCGGGEDRVILDRGDRNDAIASSCERVSRR